MNLEPEGVSGLGRPLDPAWATNRLVLALTPLAGVVGALNGWLGPVGVAGPDARGPVVTGLVTAGAAFGGWALGREVEPDRQGAAFVGMGLGSAAAILVPASSLLLLFTALMLVRVVNRTTGAAATILDDILIFGLVGWCALATGNPLVALAGAVAFGLDAGLRTTEFAPGPGRHWVVSGLALTFALWVAPDTAWGWPSPIGASAAGLVAALFLLHAVSIREITSRCDRTDVPLSRVRVRAGMVVALVVALSTVPLGDSGLSEGAPLWAALAGVAIWRGRQPSP